MHILFLHNNFPGQFKWLVKHYATSGAEITFVSMFAATRDDNVRHIVSKNPSEHPDKLTHFFHHALRKLSQKFTPDVIISHSGFNCGLYAKYYFPTVPVISYLEWWFSSFAARNFQDTEFFSCTSDLSSKLHLRNAPLSLELSQADLIICPTSFQAESLPNIFRTKLRVIFDGVPIRKLPPNHIRKNFILYASRGLEPMRCYPEFIKSIPHLRQLGLNAPILILGSDSVHYGVGRTKKQPSSFKKWAEAYLSENNVRDVHHLGKLPFAKYLKTLSTCRLHVHITQPFVPSWSLLDSMSFCSPILASQNSFTKQLFSVSSNLTLTTNVFNSHKLASDIYRSYQTADESTIKSPYSSFTDLFSLSSCLRQWIDSINSLTLN